MRWHELPDHFHLFALEICPHGRFLGRVEQIDSLSLDLAGRILGNVAAVVPNRVADWESSDPGSAGSTYGLIAWKIVNAFDVAPVVDCSRAELVRRDRCSEDYRQDENRRRYAASYWPLLIVNVIATGLAFVMSFLRKEEQTRGEQHKQHGAACCPDMKGGMEIGCEAPRDDESIQG